MYTHMYKVMLFSSFIAQAHVRNIHADLPDLELCLWSSFVSFLGLSSNQVSQKMSVVL